MLERQLKTSSSEAAEIDDTAACAHCNFESATATPSVIDEEPPAAIHAPDVSEATVAQDSLAIPARDRARRCCSGWCRC